MNSSIVCMVLLSILSLSSCAVLPRQSGGAPSADTGVKSGKGSGRDPAKAARILDAVTNGLSMNGLPGVGKITGSVASGLRGGGSA
ncbi:hypothetical protein PCANC_04836 [Puccinia coronata f. sp. avenae]|uniref:Lipoprotein n=1 Tax=Puccinia coronata f. sp. avenae TaxID=200324 RepID=A0A2N5VCB7_9BASI|nr:hypothetical protein PCASD_16854 [Puccinia coronata f. sp. avenae]PLW19687.1 hypothetical protein PCANC_08931 [Puccinia coronata f. sp. avenae]PLW47639.1 hypothetical protein PCASD_04086 [Puccinia coronata f. sp. avenae]PLW56512.1 hypothetical protein PCANC_04836 [Puccinia coronata f. sp. avenae]